MKKKVLAKGIAGQDGAYLTKILILLLSFTISALQAQEKPIVKFEIEAQAIGTTNNVVPFWLRSNQYGSIPSDGVSGSFIGRARKEYDSTKVRSFDWGAGLEGRVNGGKNSKLLLIEGYAKVKAGIFQIKAGRTKDVMGLNGDSSLTSGNFSVSGNALGIPKVEISIPNYYSIPIWDGLISFKGSFSHGWLGKTKILDTIRAIPPNPYKYGVPDRFPNTFYHQKSFYGRLGKPDWNLKLYGGFNHQVFWGNERQSMGENFELSTLETFFYVATGKAYVEKTIPSSKIGNQLGSIDVGIEYDFKNITMLIYRQNLYDVGALSKLANISDGLNGISLKNKSYHVLSNGVQWKTLLLEFLYTKNQAGESWSKMTKSGDEDYYNNYYYTNGWSYNSLGLGTPFITTKSAAKPGQASIGSDYFINNRVVAFHAGIEGSIKKFEIISKLSFSKNYGTFGTSPEGHSTGIIRSPNTTNLFKTVNQFSAYLETHRSLSNGVSIGLAAAIDQGNLLYNSGGLVLKVSKSF
ncbi:capsule assembly Wzi family protein [Arcticibacter eurypsychrophilus]|uniref:capsule assembly Wzi family protein n=1 Tax=Arcticibacter eurypsychrophilus TaxID=1434752 RepID=UPI00084D3B1C|nr:capsule assembly Wzi family protein [Arcticibacter eurypsychrophilus]